MKNSITVTILLNDQQLAQLEQMTAWHNEWARAYIGAVPLTAQQFLAASLPGTITREYERERDYQEVERAGR